MITLGIETTCDETAIAIVKSGKEILSNIIFSQADLHSSFGGVYPELAAREHLIRFPSLLDLCLKEAHLSLNEIELISVAYGPGLVGSIQIGLNAAKTISIALKKPFVAVNHIEAHLYAAWMSHDFTFDPFPALGLIISGGHTALVLMKSVTDIYLIGSTIDDAMGESFDKVAKMMDLPYPGGPKIEQLANQGNPHHIPFKKGTVKDNLYAFSFSGLKTQVLYAIRDQKGLKEDIAASFQQTAFQDLIDKTKKAFSQFDCKAIFVGGGVAQSKTLRTLFEKEELPIFYPPPLLCLDNGVMIAGYGYEQFQNSGQSPLSIEPVPRIPWKVHKKEI